MGHRFLIEQVRELAAARGLRSALITFPIHPRKVMNADYRPELLTTSEEKLALLEETGVDYCFMLDFTREVSPLFPFQSHNGNNPQSLHYDCVRSGGHIR